MFPFQSVAKQTSALKGEQRLAITKTGGELGSKQYRNGARDHLEGQDSSEEKPKCRGSTIAV